jgi:hypothetical protein
LVQFAATIAPDELQFPPSLLSGEPEAEADAGMARARMPTTSTASEPRFIGNAFLLEN